MTNWTINQCLCQNTSIIFKIQHLFTGDVKLGLLYIMTSPSFLGYLMSDFYYEAPSED